MEQKKICRSCSKEIENKRSKIFCNMECYKNFMVKPKEELEQVSIIINKNDPRWFDKFFKFLSSK